MTILAIIRFGKAGAMFGQAALAAGGCSRAHDGRGEHFGEAA